MSKITQYAALATPAEFDVLPVVDVNDTSMATSGTTKKITTAALAAGIAVQNVVTGYGADPTGTADATSKIQAAITAAAVSGGAVRIPAGTYKISSALVIGASGVKLTADGPGATFINQTSTTANGISITAAAAISNVTVEGLTLTGPGSGTGVGIFGSANSGASVIERLKVSNVIISGMGSRGVQVTNTILSAFDQVKAVSNGDRGFWIDNSTTVRMSNCWATNNAFERGFYLTGVTASRLESCGSDQNAIGYEIFQCNAVTLDNCDSYNTAAGSSGLDGSSLKVNTCNTVSLRGCYVLGSNAIGAYFTGGSVKCSLMEFCEVSPGGSATASWQTDSGCNVLVFNQSVTTGSNPVFGTVSTFAGTSTFLLAMETGIVQTDQYATLKNTSTAPSGLSGYSALQALASGQPAWFNPDGLQGTLRQTLATGTTTLANSAATTNIAAASIPAGDPVAGAVYRVRCWFLASTTGAPTLTITLICGGVTLITGSAITMGSSVANQQFEFEAEVQFTSTTACAAFIRGAYSIAANSWQTSPTDVIDQAASTTVTTSSAQTLGLTAKWSAASASNTLTAYYTAERVN